ncbi:enoyl-CoA hydratase/isomerase family protein [Aestuariibacter sp. A3R04]|uniref:enoyl-CoA hydratase/isomerase family protein n=1 Tax=Aestuariibacter sp. A3R04 TaxID=2841571 RepID=UPI001C0905D5|nr:enoyl-CoA hydratase-related protein [Aestuariibacter sp. A3R04]MBU3023513.1 enoyl-CoA hydratase/isomerase family protein [Aestuariibacter sp. A3R04]
MSTVKLTVDGAVARIHIDRAEKHNALTQTMWQQIASHCQTLESSIHPRLLIVSASGQKAFCAGADIAELSDIISDERRLVDNNKVVQEAQRALQNLPFATLAAINGVCVGGGLGIAMCCDFRIAAEHSKFAITPSKLGLLYSIEDTKRLVSLVGLARAKELLFLGATIDAHTACQWGLLTHVVSADMLETSVSNFSEKILDVSPFSVAGMKKTLHVLCGTSHHSEAEIKALFDAAFSQPDFAEGAQAFLEKRPPAFGRTIGKKS